MTFIARQYASRCHKIAITVIPSNWNALGSPPWTPTLGGTLLPSHIHLESLQGQLASHGQEDAETELLTAVTSHCMCHLMPNLHSPLSSGMRFGAFQVAVREQQEPWFSGCNSNGCNGGMPFVYGHMGPWLNKNSQQGMLTQFAIVEINPTCFAMQQHSNDHTTRQDKRSGKRHVYYQAALKIVYSRGLPQRPANLLGAPSA